MLTIEPQALEQIDALPNIIHLRVEALILRLEHWPEVSGVKALRGELAGHYRLRTGDYRVQFRVRPSAAGKGKPSSGDWIVVEKVGHRDRFYKA